MIDWIETSKELPMDRETVIYWVDYPVHTLLMGSFIRNEEHGGEFMHYLDSERYKGPAFLRADSGYVPCWAHLDDPTGANSYNPIEVQRMNQTRGGQA